MSREILAPGRRNPREVVCTEIVTAIKYWRHCTHVIGSWLNTLSRHIVYLFNIGMVCVWRIVWCLRGYLGMSEPKVRWRSNLFWSIWLTACKLRSSPNGNLVCGLPRHLLKNMLLGSIRPRLCIHVYYFIETFNCLVVLMSAFLVLAHCPHMCDMDKHKGNLSGFSFQFLNIMLLYKSGSIHFKRSVCQLHPDIFIPIEND